MNLDGYSKEELWKLLVKAVHANVMYPTHMSYTRDTILHEKPDIEPLELASRLNMPLGEAIVILQELRGDDKNKECPTPV